MTDFEVIITRSTVGLFELYHSYNHHNYNTILFPGYEHNTLGQE